MAAKRKKPGPLSRIAIAWDNLERFGRRWNRSTRAQKAVTVAEAADLLYERYLQRRASEPEPLITPSPY